MDLPTSGRTVAVETLGCKVNQYETSYLLETLHRAGYSCVPFRKRADVYVVHGCAVTARAGFQTRQLLRRARRANPEALVAAAGCYAQLDADRIAGERLATHILGNPEKFALATYLDRPGTFESPCRATAGPVGSCPDFEILPVSRMHTGRTRAMLKVQDGCDSFCSYCVVPLVRGRSRSLPRRNVLAQMESLVDAGYQEIVLTGIHMGQWGKDLEPADDLAGLLAAMDSAPHPPRVRLSSLEPGEIDSNLLDLAVSCPWICPHFHIPLQSGDPDVLGRMRRPYSPSRYARLVETIHALLPDAAIGADVLAGFPGETEARFQNTVGLLESLPMSYLHVFPFSPRPGTAAARFSDRIDGRELKRRAGVLRELGGRKKRTFRERFVGKLLDVLVETESGEGVCEGLSANYINVVFRRQEGIVSGGRVPVAITGFRGDDLQGNLSKILPGR